MSYHCFSCGGELNLADGRAGRGDTCDGCGADVHVCLNCRYYDSGSYNECREPQAERVVDKERSNFCDYFSVTEGTPGQKPTRNKKDALSELDKLFK